MRRAQDGMDGLRASGHVPERAAIVIPDAMRFAVQTHVSGNPGHQVGHLAGVQGIALPAQ
ncbi:Uncharacterised protein [Mycobacteroides abscessus subsp. abscessus]|nr:Uncharacterised protein [Mycobacteroides abscessus subsp. abscessus]